MTGEGLRYGQVIYVFGLGTRCIALLFAWRHGPRMFFIARMFGFILVHGCGRRVRCLCSAVWCGHVEEYRITWLADCRTDVLGCKTSPPARGVSSPQGV